MFSKLSKPINNNNVSTISSLLFSTSTSSSSSLISSSSSLSSLSLSSSCLLLHSSFTSSSSLSSSAASPSPSSSSSSPAKLTHRALKAPVTPTSHQYSPHLAGGVYQYSDIIVDYARGAWITSTKGNKYLDFASGIGVTNLGHCHPIVNAAAITQIEKGIHLQVNCVTSQPIINLAKKFSKIIPKSFGDDYQLLFSNSGAESIENAVKLARVATGKQCIIVFQGGFHGRTIATGSMTTAKNVYRAGFQPTMAGVHVAPYPYCLRCPTSLATDGKFNINNCCNTSIEQLRLLLKQQVSGDEVAAIIIEPILGEGGYIIPPNNFLSNLRTIADEIGCLLIADEVQTGFGRTGTFFACEQFPNFTPDIIVVAKGIANGFPLSAIVTKQAIMSAAKTSSIGGTYGGNAVSCAASSAVIDVITESTFLKNVQERGVQFRTGLKALQIKYPTLISEIRGLGLMNSLEFKDTHTSAGLAGRMISICNELGLLMLSAGSHEAIRFIPPLIINEQEINQALNILDQALTKIATGAK